MAIPVIEKKFSQFNYAQELNGVFLAGYGPSGNVRIKASDLYSGSAVAGALPITFDVERNYGTIAAPLSGNLGFVKSPNDLPVTQIVIHQDTVAPADLANITKAGSNGYVVGAKNIIAITCLTPNVDYIYQIGYL